MDSSTIFKPFTVSTEDFQFDWIAQNRANFDKIAAINQQELDEIGKGGSANNKSRAIIHDNRYILLYMKESNLFEYLDYTPELYSFITRPSCCSFKVSRDERVQIELMQHTRKGDRNSPFFYRFLYYYYSMGMEVEQFAKEFPDINERSKQSKIEIDHACDNVHINCRWNLSAVPSIENNHKSDLTAQIKPPYSCVPVVTREGEYRVIYGIIDTEWWERHFILCKDMVSLIDFLRKFRNAEPCESIMKKYGSPAERYAHDNHAPFFASNFATVSRTADILLSMSEERFTVWNNDMGSGDIFLRD